MESECILDEIVTKLNSKIQKGEPGYENEKSRISHHIKDLKKDGLVYTDRKGKNLRVKLTEQGMIYMEGLKKE